MVTHPKNNSDIVVCECDEWNVNKNAFETIKIKCMNENSM